MAAPIIRIKRSATAGKKPEVANLNLGELALNTHDAELYTLRDRFAASGIATDVVRLGAGATVTNVIYVTKDGSDTNTGQKLGDAKATIKGAVAISTTGSVIRVSAGSYIEDNPIILPKKVSVVGDSLREVSVTPQNADQDLFYVNEGVYVTEMSYTGTMNPGKALFAFDENTVGYSSQSPYIRNCTNFVQNSIGMKIDGSKVIGNLNSMVTDSFTQYNANGIGVSITNEGYAQLVSLFTICNDIAVYCGSGGACDLTNSNSSFGNYGLVADGVGPLKYTGIVTESASVNSSQFVLDLNVPTLDVNAAVYDSVTGIVTITTSANHGYNIGMGVTISGLVFNCGAAATAYFPTGNYGYVFEVKDVPAANQFSAYVGASTLPHTYEEGGTVKVDVVRPFDGQVIFLDTLYYTVEGVTITNAGAGYASNTDATFSDADASWGVNATGVGNVKNGSVDNVEMVSNGRGYLSTPTVNFGMPSVGVNSATGTANIVPKYYVVSESTPISSGICTVTVTENLPYSVGVGTTVPFFKQSRIIASSHSFEYIGSGVTINSALPQSGGVPIPENEIDNREGGLVIFTSTDQAGNFKIGEGVVINQQEGTITGNFYSKSLFANVTPLILALGGD